MKSAQLRFDIRTHGGARKGAGRKKKIAHEAKHIARERIDGKTPFHLSFKLHEKAPSLRSPNVFKRILKGFNKASNKGLRINQFAFESNHGHLIGEADSNETLTRGIQSLLATITWALRDLVRYFGPIFKTRYFMRALKTPRETRNALTYCLFNHAKHLGVERFADVFSSAFAFDEILVFVAGPLKPPPWQIEIEMALQPPRSWMQTHGWRKGWRH